jgi:hypothetical protein
MKVKVISIFVLRTSSFSIVFLLSPGTTVGAVLNQLRVKDKDYVLFPASDPARLFDQKDELYDRVENGARLIAAGLAEASEAYRRSRAYHYNPPNNIM